MQTKLDTHPKAPQVAKTILLAAEQRQLLGRIVLTYWFDVQTGTIADENEQEISDLYELIWYDEGRNSRRPSRGRSRASRAT